MLVKEFTTGEASLVPSERLDIFRLVKDSPFVRRGVDKEGNVHVWQKSCYSNDWIWCNFGKSPFCSVINAMLCKLNRSK